jgi:hypothetical protein
MPASNAFTGFTTTGGNTSTASQFNVDDNTATTFSANKGWNFYSFGKNGATAEERTSSPTIFFPAAGYRSNSDGALSRVGTYGGYWSAVPQGARNGRSLYFYKTYVGPLNYYYRAYGFSVRPVKE